MEIRPSPCPRATRRFSGGPVRRESHHFSNNLLLPSPRTQMRAPAGRSTSQERPAAVSKSRPKTACPTGWAHMETVETQAMTFPVMCPGVRA